MRARLALLIALVPALTALAPVATPAAHARSGLVLAQDEKQEQQQGDEAQPSPDVEGETQEGGQTEEGTSETEAGRPWTYQMARLGIALLALLGLGIAFWYYRLVARRGRGVA